MATRMCCLRKEVKACSMCKMDISCKIEAWNVRGLGKKVNEVTNLIKDENLNVCAVLETHVKDAKVSDTCNKIFGDWLWATNSRWSPTGCRIMLGWDQRRVQVMVINCTKQTMFCLIEDVCSKLKIYCTFVYAMNDGRDRILLWKELINHKVVAGNDAWCLMGDFNVTLKLDEHSDGMSSSSFDMQEFHECVAEIEVDDINKVGFHFTWTKSLLNPSTATLKKLDRIMRNSKMIQVYPEAHACFLPYVVSDHSPAILVIPNCQERKKRSFRFSNYITDKPEFLPVVKEEWGKEVTGFKMFILAKKMKNLKKSLKKLSWKNGNLFEKVKELREKVKQIQTRLDNDVHNADLKKESVAVLKEYNEAVMDEEKLLVQLANVKWLNEGDKNTAYFHQVIKGKRHKNHISIVYDEEGKRYEGNEVPMQFVKHFEKFLGVSTITRSIENVDELSSTQVTDLEAENMCSEVSLNEIKEALKSIDDSKAPGPDGYTAKNFKVAWSVVGEDLCNAVKEFFSSGKILGEMNASIISLVPKTKTPSKVLDYRPIACCNVVYKLISKILTNRLKQVLCRIICQNQSAFIPGRSIIDNILITQELLKGYGSKNGKERCALKIDIMKAYDSVSWSFLEEVLVGFGFPRRFINWIMICIRNASFSICVNGESHGYFKSGRGLRQGDPISPYLFTMVMEVLTLILQRNISQSGVFKYHQGCEVLKITSLCFADDFMILSNGDADSIMIIKQALDEFSEYSGLHPNLGKSTLFYSNISEEVKKSILEILPFTVGSLPVKYLGVPLVTKRLSVTNCKNLIERVKSRINDWKNKFLSYAGRMQLIASILAAMQNYWANVFFLPKTVTNDIDRLLKDFLWSQGEKVRGKAKIAWKSICRPKEQGGLGFKPLENWNNVLMVKHLWNVASKKDSLWVKWVNIYRLKGRSIWEIDNDSNASWGWNKLLSLRDMVRPFIKHSLGNGQETNMWHDTWCEGGPLDKFITSRQVFSAGFSNGDTVENLSHNGHLQVPIDWCDQYPVFNEASNIILNPSKKDEVKWLHKMKSLVKFSVNKAWKDLRPQGEEVLWSKVVWFPNLIPKHAFILWLLMHERLPTQDKILKWYPNMNLRCSLCNNGQDSHDYLFFNCNYSRMVWQQMKRVSRIQCLDNSWKGVLDELIALPNVKSIWIIVQKLVFAASVYFLWQERNVRLFQNNKRKWEDLCSVIQNNVRLKLSSLKVLKTSSVQEAFRVWEVSMTD